MTLLLSIFFGVLAAFWLGLTLVALRAVLALRDLPPMATDSSHRPTVSVVIPARNEEERIETTVRRLLGQQGVELELIVVNDRSTDRTDDILERLKGEDPRLRVVRNESLPAGWIGQCYALHLGGEQASGQWLLFTDADIWMMPDVVARAVQAAEAQGADHVCLMPRQHAATLCGQAAMIALLIAVAESFRRVNARPTAHAAFGAFNLVRTSAYHQIGGHVPLRLEINNDSKLGLLLSRAGRRTRAFFGGRDLEMDMARTPAQFIRAMEKNAFSSLRFNLPVALLVVMLSGLCLLTPLGPAVAGTPGIVAVVMWLGYSAPAIILARRCGWSAVAGLLAPIVSPVALLTVVNSLVVTLRQGGVRWRDQFYSLDTLREGMVR